MRGVLGAYFYSLSFHCYLLRSGVMIDYGDRPLLGVLLMKYPAEFVAWRTSLLITTGIDPMAEDDKDGWYH